MKICLFYHSISSNWNHGSAHFLRGIVTSLLSKGHHVTVYEPMNGWSFTNMISETGVEPVSEFSTQSPESHVRFFNEEKFIPFMLNEVDMVIVHEWNKPELIKKIGTHKKYYGNYILLFHDTLHRSITSMSHINHLDLSGYDGVLAFGDQITQYYLQQNITKNAWTWHEAADINIYKPVVEIPPFAGDLVWVGNISPDDRTEALVEYIIEPVVHLGLKATFYGVPYPESFLSLLNEAKINFGGWVPNHRLPQIYAQYKVTVNVPHHSFSDTVPGIPAFKFFEAMACGIPLISAPWEDNEQLFRTDVDYLSVKSGTEMQEALKKVVYGKKLAKALTHSGLDTILNKHTCDHRVQELLQIYALLKEKTQKETV